MNLVQEKTKGVFWRDTVKVAKNFLGPKMPLFTFWQMLNFGETLSEEEEKVLATSESVSPKLSICQNAESGILGPRKFLATFKVSRQNKP